MAPSPPILPPPHPVLLAAVIILVSGLHSKGTAATNVDRHSNVQKPGHARQTRQIWMRRSGQIRHSMKRQSMPSQSMPSVAGGRQKLGNARGQKCRIHPQV